MVNGFTAAGRTVELSVEFRMFAVMVEIVNSVVTGATLGSVWKLHGL